MEYPACIENGNEKLNKRIKIIYRHNRNHRSSG